MQKNAIHISTYQNLLTIFMLLAHDKDIITYFFLNIRVHLMLHIYLLSPGFIFASPANGFAPP